MGSMTRAVVEGFRVVQIIPVSANVNGVVVIMSRFFCLCLTGLFCSWNWNSKHFNLLDSSHLHFCTFHFHPAARPDPSAGRFWLAGRVFRTPGLTRTCGERRPQSSEDNRTRRRAGGVPVRSERRSAQQPIRSRVSWTVAAQSTDRLHLHPTRTQTRVHHSSVHVCRMLTKLEQDWLRKVLENPEKSQRAGKIKLDK